METSVCPSCKKKISNNAKKCPTCGFTFRRQPSVSRTGVMAVAVIIIIAVTAYVLSDTPERELPPAAQNLPEEMLAETLKDIHGTEFSLDDIVAKFNSFMRDEGFDSYCIGKLVPELGDGEDVYRDIKKEDDIGISMVTPKGRSTVTSVFVSAQRGSRKPVAFMTYCFGLMNVNATLKRAMLRWFFWMSGCIFSVSPQRVAASG